MAFYCRVVAGIVFLLLLSTQVHYRVFTRWMKDNKVHLDLPQLSALLTMDKVSPTKFIQKKSEDKTMISALAKLKEPAGHISMINSQNVPEDHYGNRLKRTSEIIPPFVRPQLSYSGLFHPRHYRDIHREHNLIGLERSQAKNVGHSDSGQSDKTSIRQRRSLMSYIPSRKKNGYGGETALGRWGRSLPIRIASGDITLRNPNNSVKQSRGTKFVPEKSKSNPDLEIEENDIIASEIKSYDKSKDVLQSRKKRSWKPKGKVKGYMAYRLKNGYGSTKNRWG